MRSQFSIVIPTLNEERSLPELLQSIAGQTFTGDVEVIVVDGESTDRTKEAALAFQNLIPGLRVMITHKGLSHQRNLGASKARYQRILFIDADSMLSRDFLGRLSNQIGTESNLVALPLILPLRGGLFDYIFTLGAYLFFSMVRYSGPITSGMCIVTTQINHRRVGGFSEEAAYAEDIEYGLRSWRHGAKYHIYFRSILYGSPRRGREMGRIKLGIMWLRWYFDTRKNGPIKDKSKYDYQYGNYPRL